MSTRTKALFDSAVFSLPRVALIGSLGLAVPALAGQGPTASAGGPIEHDHTAMPSALVQIVRDATRQFVDVNAATSAGYGPFLGCVTGPDHGAMWSNVGSAASLSSICTS